MALRRSGLFVCALCFLCGCATLSSMPGAFSQAEGRLPDDATVRSQDAPLSAAWTTPSPQTSDVRPAGHVGHSKLSPVSSADAQTLAPGHTFAQPKARLGRPILKGQPSAMETDASSQAKALNPSRERTLPDPAADDAKSKSEIRRQSTSPWSTNDQLGWQSAPETSQPWSRSNPSKPANKRDTGNTGAAPKSSQSSQAVGRAVSPTKPSAALQDTLETSPEISAESQDSPDQDVDNAVAPIVPEEPTMLDRLRGLYSPRVDDNADKLKKQMRRWPDPFGLLKDRDDTAETPPADSPTSEPDRPVQTAEAEQLPNGFKSRLQDPGHSIQNVIAEVEQQLTDWPRTPSGKPEQPDQWRQRQTDLRLLYMISGRSAESIRVIESLPEAEQEFWQSLMLSMNRYREPSDGVTRPEQLTESLQHLRTAAKKLQPLSILSIQRLMLCDRIDGFGNVVGFPTANFEPGQRILVYAELQNFQSELTSDSKYRSEFAAVIEFMREGDDEVVETLRVPQMEDLCDVERTDYFHSYELTLPALEGKYMMRIRLRDQLSLQTAESQLEFTIRSRGTGL